MAASSGMCAPREGSGVHVRNCTKDAINFRLANTAQTAATRNRLQSYLEENVCLYEALEKGTLNRVPWGMFLFTHRYAKVSIHNHVVMLQRWHHRRPNADRENDRVALPMTCSVRSLEIQWFNRGGVFLFP
jgi:endonuclease I